MKRYIPIVASLMVFSLISCGEVMDLTQPEKAEVTYSNITLSLYQTGKYDLYLDEPEYQYNIMVEKSHCEKEAKAKLAVVDAKEFGEEYHLLPVEYYDLDGNNFNFKGDDVLRMVNLRFHDLGTLDGSKKYVLGLKLVSDDLAVNQEKSTMTFFLQQKQGEIDNPYTVATTSDLITLGEKLKDGKTIYAKIENDIDLQGVDWQPIETSVSKQLVLDGGGHTIRNLKVNTSSSVNQGFFGLLVGKCSNINFENAQITANTKVDRQFLPDMLEMLQRQDCWKMYGYRYDKSDFRNRSGCSGITVRLVVSVQDFMVQIVKFISVHRQRILLPYGAPAVFVGKREAEQRSLNALPLGIL